MVSGPLIQAVHIPALGLAHIDKQRGSADWASRQRGGLATPFLPSPHRLVWNHGGIPQHEQTQLGVASPGHVEHWGIGWLLSLFATEQGCGIALEHVDQSADRLGGLLDGLKVCARSLGATASHPARSVMVSRARSPSCSTGIAASVSLDRDLCACPSAPRAGVNVSFALLASGATWPSISRKNFWASTMATRAESAAVASLDPRGSTWSSVFLSSSRTSVTGSFRDTRACFNAGVSRRVFVRLSVPSASESSASSGSRVPVSCG
jgi:hypothetical protein